MSTNLLITEKKSTAEPFIKYLGLRDRSHAKGGTGYVQGTHDGDTWIVTWCFGHTLEPLMPDEYDERYKRWNLDDLPFIPKKWRMKPSSGVSGKQYREIYHLLKDGHIDMLYHAGDSDREGELIVREILTQTKAEKIPAKRLWYSTLTQSNIPKILAAAKPLSDYDSTYKSAQLRQFLDYVYGINLSRAYTIHYHGTRNVGRVVSPTIGMVVRREEEIENFKPEQYALVSALLRRDGKQFVAKTRYSDIPKAKRIAEAIKGKIGRITSVESKDAKTRRKLYKLTDLQVEASRLFGYEPNNTLAIVQSLYERGWMTYPRTNSDTITPDDEGWVSEALPKALEQVFGSGDGTANPSDLDVSRVVKVAKEGDYEASHPGLCPTLEGIAAYRTISQDTKQDNVFRLVAGRMLAACLPERVEEKTKVGVDIESEPFAATGSVEKVPGYKPFEDWYMAQLPTKRKRKQAKDATLPVLAVGDEYDVARTKVEEKETEPPKRFTTATLTAAMENIANVMPEKAMKDILKSQEAGLGTQASRGTIIATIKKNKFVETKGGYLYPTQKARELIGSLPENIKSPEMTARMEIALDNVMTGKADPDKFVRRVVETITRQVDDVKGMKPVPDTARYADAKVLVKGGCPKCGGNVVITKKSYTCANGCGFVIWQDIAKKHITQKEAKSLCEDGRSTEKLSGFKSKKGNEFACWLYLDDDAKVAFDFDDQGRNAANNYVTKDVRHRGKK